MKEHVVKLIAPTKENEDFFEQAWDIFNGFEPFQIEAGNHVEEFFEDEFKKEGFEPDAFFEDLESCLVLFNRAQQKGVHVIRLDRGILFIGDNRTLKKTLKKIINHMQRVMKLGAFQ